jgi:hypothetical protein
MTDCRKEFPVSWFKHAKLSPHQARASLNYFGVNASQTLSEWRRKGWFQWYCRNYSGRRYEHDLPPDRSLACGSAGCHAIEEALKPAI